MEKVGIEQLGKIIDAVGEAINVIDKIVDGGGVWNALAITDELSALGGLSGEGILNEIKDCSEDERKALFAQLQAKCPLIKAHVGVLDECVAFGFKCYADGLAIKTMIEVRVAEGKILVEKVKQVVA